MSTHADLITALTRLEAHKQAIQRARQTLNAHASERMEGIRKALPGIEDARDADEDDGGVLGHRFHRTLLDERERLARHLAPR